MLGGPLMPGVPVMPGEVTVTGLPSDTPPGPIIVTVIPGEPAAAGAGVVIPPGLPNPPRPPRMADIRCSRSARYCWREMVPVAGIGWPPNRCAMAFVCSRTLAGIFE